MNKDFLSAIVNQLAYMIIIFAVMVIAYAVFYAIKKHKTGFAENKRILYLLFGYMIILVTLTSMFMGNAFIRLDGVPQDIVEESYILSNIILPIGDFFNNLFSTIAMSIGFALSIPLLLLLLLLSALSKDNNGGEDSE